MSSVKPARPRQHFRGHQQVVGRSPAVGLTHNAGCAAAASVGIAATSAAFAAHETIEDAGLRAVVGLMQNEGVVQMLGVGDSALFQPSAAFP